MKEALIEFWIWLGTKGKDTGIKLALLGVLLAFLPIFLDTIATMVRGFWEVRLWGKAVIIQLLGLALILWGLMAEQWWKK